MTVTPDTGGTMATEKDPDKGDPQEPDKGDPQEPDKGKDLDSEVEKWKALARKHEKQAKENADAAKRLKELEDADKSEIEKAVEKATTAEKRAQEAELRALRMEIAAEKGLTASQAKRLVGSTKEELESDAAELLEAFGAAKEENGQKPPARKPTERLKGGAEPDESGPDPDMREVVSKIPRGI